jgi:chemotaxis protein MotB
MQSKDENAQAKAPIIIKKITLAHHGHHGGAWKVAYADFVTAMMAFFLLMWLLNSIPSEKLQGIAEYFEPTIGLSGQKGIGFQGGTARDQTKGVRSQDKTIGVKYGVISTGEIVEVKEAGPQVTEEEKENERFALVEGELKKSILKESDLKQYQENINFELTPEGLMITVSGQDKYPMFKPGSAELTDFTKTILFRISKLLQFSPNFIAIAGYTDKTVNTTDQTYTNWELSADRANAARRYLLSSGIPPEQIARITARADTDPIDINNPYSPQNRRITITLLRNSIMPYNKIAAPKELLSTPSRNDFDDNLSPK